MKIVRVGSKEISVWKLTREKSLAQLGREYGVTHQTVVYHRDRNSDTIEGIRNELKAQGKYRGN